MKYLFLDLETYYDQEYSLKRMTPLEYALDPRFEALGCGFIDGGGARLWVEGPDLPRFFDDVDWPNTWAISHNALFDMVVLSFRYGKVAGRYGDTLAMARNQLGHKLKSLSLESLAKYFGLSAKMTTLQRMVGVGYQQLIRDPALHQEMKAYGIDDTVKCRTIFANLIAGGFPPGQLDLIDWVVRMAADPQLEWDKELLHEHLAQVRADKAQLLAEAGISEGDKSSIMSDQQLSVRLWFLGVRELPRKLSKTTGKEQFAFAKTDKQFTALLEHPNPRVQALVAARLGHKSTMEESRSERLIAISRLTDKAPVPLKYSGAHTHRYSGDWKINLQNLLRGGTLRQALKAPKGKLLVSSDASQIEARLNGVLAGQDDLVEDFRAGIDVYCKFAEDIYHFPVNKKEHPAERFVGKTGILQLGYGSSWVPFQNMCRVKSDPMHPINLKDNEAAEVVRIYRNRFKRIVHNWHFAEHSVLPALAFGRSEVTDIAAGITGAAPNDSLVLWGPLVVQKGRIVLPNGNCLYYNDLHREAGPDGRMQWLFKRAEMPVKTYGAKIVENVTQALAFVHIMEVAVRVWVKSGHTLWPAHQVHDDLIYVVDERIAEPVARLVQAEMSVPPSWLPDAPLAAAASIGPNYKELVEL